MKIAGELINNHIIVKKPKDAGRLYNKSHFGKTLSKGYIQLDLLEGVFLLGENKIKITHGKTTVDFQDLVKQATIQDPDFEMKYLVYKDLRNRGLAIKSCAEQQSTTFYVFTEKTEHRRYICAFSERDRVELSTISAIIKEIRNRDGQLWFAIVDEEGDLTYYLVSFQQMIGQINEHQYPKGKGILLSNRILLFEKNPANALFTNEFYGKPFGVGIQLSLVEGAYLLERNIITLYSKQGKKLSKKDAQQQISNLQPDIALRLLVYNDLKKQGLIVKTGFKFGVHFRAYTKKPGQTHAEYLVHVVKNDFTSIWAEMSRAVRLAHSVNKEIVFARVDGTTIEYIKFGRLRP